MMMMIKNDSCLRIQKQSVCISSVSIVVYFDLPTLLLFCMLVHVAS